jgi:hypothetical protein
LLLEHVLWLVPRFVVALLRRDTGTLSGYGSAFRRLPRAVRSRRGARAMFRRSDRAVLDLVSASTIEAGRPAVG